MTDLRRRGAAAVEGGETVPLLGPTVDPAAADRARLPRLARHSITLDDGHEVGISICGEGIPLVVVHGFTAEGILYAQALRRLVDFGFKVVAVDTAGHGGTQGLPTGGGSFTSYAELLGRVLELLGVRKSVLLGHSMGGRLVTEHAARHTAQAIAVVPVNGVIGRQWDQLMWLSRVFPPTLVAIAAILVADTLSTAPVFRDQRQAMKLGRLVFPTLVGHLRRPWRLLGPAISLIRSRGSGWMLDALRDGQVPVFVIHSELDFVVPFATAKSAAKRADGDLVVVERATHSWLLKDPETLPAIIEQLLDNGLGQAIARAKKAAGLDADASPADVDRCPEFYDQDGLALALTPPDDPGRQTLLDRAPRYRWRVRRR
ncbi:MAG: alpha/beta fold hydrolase [Acidimicrobiales bacterium]